MDQKSSRRSFLTAKFASTGGSLQSFAEAARRPKDKTAPLLLRIWRQIMACRFEMLAPAHPEFVEVANKALDLADELERKLSYFRPESQISLINHLAKQEPVPVDSDVFQLLERAIEISQQTGGAFDITATPLWKAWGFAKRQGRIPSDEQLQRAISGVGSDLIRLDRGSQTVQLLGDTTELNLGAIGKGYAVDRCSQLLEEHGFKNYLVSAGYSSMLARGNSFGDQDGTGQLSGWTVGIRHPLRPDIRVAELQLVNRTLATSAATFQSFESGGKVFGHIIDPRTGQPVSHVLSATVLAPDATLADALSTAFCVMSIEEVDEFCQHCREISAILLGRGRRALDLEFHLFNLEKSDLKILSPLEH